MSAEVLWSIIGTLVTIIIALVSVILAVRNELAKRSEQRWQRAISYAQIFSDEGAPILVKQVARLALYDAGIEIRDYEERANKSSMGGLDTVIDAFDVPPSEDQAGQLKAVLGNFPEAGSENTLQQDPELRAIVGAISYFKDRVFGLEMAFAHARRDGRLEDDTRIRIFLVLVAFAAGFLTLMFTAVKSAFVPS
jgi:hypothetical protein